MPTIIIQTNGRPYERDDYEFVKQIINKAPISTQAAFLSFSLSKEERDRFGELLSGAVVKRTGNSLIVTVKDNGEPVSASGKLPVLRIGWQREDRRRRRRVTLSESDPRFEEKRLRISKQGYRYLGHKGGVHKFEPPE